jgi:hypothetical protein
MDARTHAWVNGVPVLRRCMPWEVPKEKDLAAHKAPRATVSFSSAGVRSALVLAVCRMLLLFWLELPLLLLSVGSIVAE